MHLGVHHPDDGRLRPARQRRAEVISALRGCPTGRDAWRILGYQEDATRRVFRLVAEKAQEGEGWQQANHVGENMDGGRPIRIGYALFDLPYPHTVEDAAAFAADAPHSEEAEGAAVDYARAMRPWWFGAAPGERIAWRFLRRNQALARQPSAWNRDVVTEALEQAFDLAGRPLHRKAGRVVEPFGSLWREAANLRLAVPVKLEDRYGVYGASGPPPVADDMAGACFAEIPNPFVALERLAGLGYELAHVGADALVLLGAAPDA